MNQWLHIILIKEDFDMTINMQYIINIMSQDKQLSLILIQGTVELITRDVIAVPEMLKELHKTGICTLYAIEHRVQEH
jgi:hypothetical protein